MKKSLFHLAMALCIGLFASCSQDEIVSGTNGGEETVSISTQLPQDIHTRALPSVGDNHQLRCILEVWDKAEDGQLLTRIEKLASEATDGKLKFSFTVPSTTNYQCLLWADFIATDAATSNAETGTPQYADKYYNTANLKAIDFKVADASLFNNVASDAFCGKVDKNGTTTELSVTLKRPFTKVTLTDKSDYIADCTGLAVEYETPSGYNIATGTTTAYKPINATNLTPDTNSKTWFSTYIFASADKQKLDKEIKMTVTKTGGSTEIKKIKPDQITLDDNVENNAEANFAAEDEVSVDVDVDGEVKDPNAPQIGYFLNKDGSTSKDFNKENAIGIVFAVGAKGDDKGSNYGGSFTDNSKIYGYAMGLTSAVRSYLGANGSDSNPLPAIEATGSTPWEEGDYNGYLYSQKFTTAFHDNATSAAFNNYKTWLSTNNHSAQNLSPWYIPSGRQIYDISTMIFGLKSGDGADEATKNSDFITAYNTVLTNVDKSNLDLGATGACWMMSSYMADAAVAVIVTNKKNQVATDPVVSVSTTNANWSPGSRVAIRPVLTIFKPTATE